MAVLEQHDRFAPIRNALRDAASGRDWYGGVPMPLDGERLVVHPSHPFAEAFAADPKPASDEDTSLRLRGQFWSVLKGSTVLVIEENGVVKHGLLPGVHHLKQDIATMGCADAWGIEQEAAALATLAGLVPHHAFKRYLLTGMFLERSERSGVVYLFRRLKPSVAISYHGENEKQGGKILAALCLHPIAFYDGSWAGAMCPTDDVIAHLMLMRGDERLFWSRANQHAPHLPEAGL